MLLTISTTHQPATDLGYLLHKSPGRIHTVDLPFGTARAFYTEVSNERCTAALVVDIDPVSLVRKPKGQSDSGPLVAYVNDRGYASSSLLSTALTKTFGSALSGRSRERQELAETPIPLEAYLPALSARGGEALIRGLFEPLGYFVAVDAIPLDPHRPEWGASRYFSVTLSGTLRLADLLSHLYVLVPVLDDAKHYWIGTDEVEKLVMKGSGWLERHPLKPMIVRRALRRRQRFVREALEQLTEDEPVTDPDAEPAEEQPEEVVERSLSLNEQRLGAVQAALAASGARRILDLGCGEGKLFFRLLADPLVERVLAMDVSFRQVEAARALLKRHPSRVKARGEAVQGSLLYQDERMLGYDAAALVEVIEHIEPSRLRWMEHSLFGHARPRTVVVTTPNVEYNVRFETLPAGQRRHGDHRFEWTRAEFAAWASRVGEAYSYHVRHLPIGPEDPDLGPPTQMAVFDRWT